MNILDKLNIFFNKTSKEEIKCKRRILKLIKNFNSLKRLKDKRYNSITEEEAEFLCSTQPLVHGHDKNYFSIKTKLG